MAKESIQARIFTLVNTIYYKPECGRTGRNRLLIIFTCFLLLISCKVNSQIRILFVGDILLSRNVESEIKSRHTIPWENLKTEFHSADLLIGNLEGAVGKSQQTSTANHGSPVFTIDSVDIGLLGNAGFNVITVENNHSMDLGLKGKRKTIEALQNSNITPVSFDNSPWFFSVKDSVIALVAYNLITGADGIKVKLDSIGLKQKLRLARSLADVVIVSIHWGSELLEWPDREQRETAGWLIKHGADLIVGSHPHVIQKPEIIHGKPVFFSLGNHLFDQKYPETKEGLIIDIHINKGKMSCEGIVTHTRPNSFYPEITKRVDFGFEPLQMKNNSFRMNGYMIKPVSVRDSLGSKLILQAYENSSLIWKTHPIPIVSIASAKLDGVHDYLFMLERHYSNMDNEVSLRPYVYSVDHNGIFARWRGSALAWPILDAVISSADNKTLCVLHRGDSYIKIDKTNPVKRFATYIWNGFGFTGTDDLKVCDSCKLLMNQ